MNRQYWLVCYLAVFTAIILRFAAPSLVFFGPDEALLQLIADRYFDLGQWPLVGLVGTKGVYYGPVPSWIYIGLRSILPHSVHVVPGLFYLVSMIQFSALIYFITGLRGQFSRGVWLIVSVFVLSLPVLTFFSRQLWDNTFLIVVTHIFAGTFFRWSSEAEVTDRQILFRWIFGGFCAGAALGIHLMALPLVLGIVFVCSQFTDRRRLPKAVLFFVAAALVFVGPYVYGLIVTPPVISEVTERAFNPIRWLTGLRTLIVQWSDWLSWNGFLSYFSPHLGAEIFKYMNWVSMSAGRLLFGLTLLLQILVTIIVVWAVVRSALTLSWNLSDRHRSLVCFAGILGVGHVMMAVCADATTQIHYFQAVWWTPLIPLGLWLDHMARARAKARVLQIIAFLSVVNLYMSFLAGHLFVKSSGFPELGPSYELQRAAVLELCRIPGEVINIAETPSAVTFPAIRWVSKHDHFSQCRDKTFVETSNGEALVARFSLTGEPHIHWETFVRSSGKNAN